MDANNATNISSVVSAVATAVLACITAYYAWHTKNMANAMSRQIVPDIHISNACAEVDPIYRNEQRGSFVRVRFTADITNRNSAGGSVEVPWLFFILKDGTRINPQCEKQDEVYFLQGGDYKKIYHDYCLRHIKATEISFSQESELRTDAVIAISCKDNLGRDCGVGIPVLRRNRQMTKVNPL